MKKILILFFFSFFISSCSTENKCIEVYLKNEREKNRFDIAYYTLFDKKTEVSRTLRAYSFKADNVYKVKSFNEEDYIDLSNTYKNDTIIQFWKEKEIRKLDFSAIAKTENFSSKNNYINKVDTKSKIYYSSLSKPLFNKNNKEVMFGLSIFEGAEAKNLIESSLIIMKKENGQWILVEKFPSIIMY